MRSEAASPASSGGRRFAVAWRDRSRWAVVPVAVLDATSLGYRFQYLRHTSGLEGFRPFIGFPDLDAVYEAQRLWPFFDLRVMDRKRPDYPQYVQWLGLDDQASRLDILGRSGGERKGDNVYLIEAPTVTRDGASESIFLARGVSYAVKANATERSADELRAGDRLLLVDDPTNEVNSRALVLATSDGAPIGWVPDLLIDYARRVRAAGGSASIVQNNGPDSPWHLRLLVRLAASDVTTSEGVFTGENWPSVPHGKLAVGSGTSAL